MRIAVDAMGGDFAPDEIVAGAVKAANELTGIDKIILVGNEPVVRESFKNCGIPEKIEIFHASETIEMNEPPARAVRSKKDSSINRMVDLVKKGDADAMLSAGNTGAVVASSILKLRTLKGIQRPAIAAVMPTPKKPFILIDAGANTNCSPNLLTQFAVMGSVYSKLILRSENPVVGSMSVGTEDNKGNEITKEVFRLLSKSPLNFKGNIEGHDLFEGEIDVAVCDGFTGNVILKTSESVAHAVGAWMKNEFTNSPVRMIGAGLLSGAIKAMKQRMNPENYGGAPLLGINGICIICHGVSSSKAIFHAIRVSAESVKLDLNRKISEEVERLGKITGEKNE